jgi:hypothetical protein
MKTKKSIAVGAILMTAAVLGLSPAGFAQSDPAKSMTPAKLKKPVPKSPKVWTDDDLGTRSPAAATNQSQSAVPSALQDAAATNQTSTAAKPKSGGAPPVLTNPKSLEDADKMIAWENRDIDAQQEGLEKLKAQIADAPADQRERLMKVLEQRAQILADTRNELKNLQTKRKDLDKPPSN